MDLATRSQVYARDGRLGRATLLVLDPIKQRVTYLVAKDAGGDERLWPMENVAETERNRIVLRGDKAAFAALPLFKATQFIKVDAVPAAFELQAWDGLSMSWPSGLPTA